MDKDRGTDCRGGAARHSAAWLPVIRTSCSLLFQAICVLSARIPAGADELCFKKNVPVRSRLREDTCQDAAATQRNAGVGFPSFRFSFPGTLFPASGMSGGSRSLLFGQRAVCHAFAQATDGDTPSYAGKCSVGFSAPAAEADGRCGGGWISHVSFSGCKCRKNNFITVMVMHEKAAQMQLLRGSSLSNVVGFHSLDDW